MKTIQESIRQATEFPYDDPRRPLRDAVRLIHSMEGTGALRYSQRGDLLNMILGYMREQNIEVPDDWGDPTVGKSGKPGGGRVFVPSDKGLRRGIYSGRSYFTVRQTDDGSFLSWKVDHYPEGWRHPAIVDTRGKEMPFATLQDVARHPLAFVEKTAHGSEPTGLITFDSLLKEVKL